jgi:hypothetical protein
MKITPAFFALEASDRSSWRGTEITKAFLEYLDMKEASCADEILSNVRKGRAKEAEILSGKLEAYQELKSALYQDGHTAKIEVEEEFIDPAALRTK